MAHLPSSIFPVFPTVLFAALSLVVFDAAATENQGVNDHQDHSHHQEMLNKRNLEKSNYEKSFQSYSVPNLELLDQRGDKVNVRSLMAADYPTLVQFIFTTCTTICPVLSASFSSVQDELDGYAIPYQMISITIDPEHDTPGVLFAYSQQLTTRDNWHFLTGSKNDIARVLKAFEVSYPGNNKMYHQPFIFLKAKTRGSWVRLEGLLSKSEINAEYRALLNQAGLAYATPSIQ